MNALSRRMQKEVVNVLFCGFLLVLALLLLGDLSKVKMSPFDYLASSAVPSALCWVLIFLTLIVLVRSVLVLYRGGSSEPADAQAEQPENASMSTPLQVLLVGLISTAYVVTINFALVPYAVSTTLMLASCMTILAPNDKRNWVLILGLSILIGGGCAYVFTEILPLPFPGFG